MTKTRLYISNLPDGVHENSIRKAFSNFGDVVSLDLKSKVVHDNNTSENKFAFITLSASNNEIESCIRHFTSEDFFNKRLYVTRARESFLERLHRERLEASDIKMTTNESNEIPKNNTDNTVKKKKLDQNVQNNSPSIKAFTKKKTIDHSDFEFSNKVPTQMTARLLDNSNNTINSAVETKLSKKQDSDKKRLESMKLKRKEFKEKQKLIKIGLVEIDKMPKNKKIIFSENEETPTKNTSYADVSNNKEAPSKLLFDDDDEDDNSMMEVDFEVKEKFGQKILELQSRYKSDKRFTLDERFIEDEENEQSNKDNVKDTNEAIETAQVDEKAKQLNILQEVLGVSIKSRPSPTEESKVKKKKLKMGMLRFDPNQPDHAKFLLPVDNNKNENKKEDIKSSKKKKKDKNLESQVEPSEELEKKVQRVEVSKEQFYEISDTLKEAIKQPHSFSLRSMFARDDDDNEKDGEQDASYIQLEPKKVPKIKNPLDPGDNNPFKYDSSDSEIEEEIKHEPSGYTEIANVWKENLFFSADDKRFKEGLAFFNKTSDAVKKERRDLKSIMKKRLYNKDRKNQMFRKKVGGRKKTFKKSTRRRN